MSQFCGAKLTPYYEKHFGDYLFRAVCPLLNQEKLVECLVVAYLTVIVSSSSRMIGETPSAWGLGIYLESTDQNKTIDHV